MSNYRVTETVNGMEYEVLSAASWNDCVEFCAENYESYDEEDELQVSIQKRTTDGWTTEY